MVGAVWITLAIASGLYFSFPIFFVALFEEFGWSRGATAAAFSISSVRACSPRWWAPSWIAWGRAA